MSAKMKTPGVYIQELDAFGNSVVPIPTAVPVFIGYTQNTSHNGASLLNMAFRLSSLTDFLTVFGEDPPRTKFDIVSTTTDPDFTTANSQGYNLNPTTVLFKLHAAMKLFYANGGCDCFVMSIGDYTSLLDKTKFTNAIDLLKNETEPTVLVIPDAVIFDDQSAYDIANKMINHCAETKDKVSILDIPNGFEDLQQNPNCIDSFRNSVGGIISSSNSYAAAYYPWLHTSIYQFSDISYDHLTESALSVLNDLLNQEFPDSALNQETGMAILIANLTNIGAQETSRNEAHFVLSNQSASYKVVLTAIQKKLNLLPPSAAMVGIYTAVDSAEGVWKAPANVTVQSVIKPAVTIDHDTQQDLNVPINGKSVCAIRTFPGHGTLVWGARTLDGNSNDFRYINVRRSLIYIEQSVKDACKAYVFASNDANTWTQVQSMIENFLTGLWRQGGLVGPKPADAFSVSVGLGTTMTVQDITNGIMRISLAVALSRPAEFIVISFEQQMQRT